MRWSGRIALACAAFASVGAAPAKQESQASGPDPDNPSCPGKPEWGPLKIMTITPAVKDGKHILILDGVVEETLPARLKAEVWLQRKDQTR